MSETLLLGSYTEAPARGVGVSLLAFDPATGGLETRDTLGGLVNPSWLLPHGDIVYAACEAAPGLASLATIDLAPALSLRRVSPVAGDLPCHLDIVPNWLAAACYGDGKVVVHALDAAGTAGAQAVSTQHYGGGPEPRRQAGPHAHAVGFSPDRRWLLVPDLGTDAIWCHRFDAATGALDADARRWQAPPGSGPRHASFAAGGRHVVLVTELSRTVMVLAWHDGTLAPMASLDIAGPGTAAALRWHVSGKLLAVSIRGSDSIALVGFDAATGGLVLHDLVSCGGMKPRDCCFSPCGAWLLVANQDSDNIAVLRLDPQRRRLIDGGMRHEAGSPASLQFLSRRV